MALIQGPWERWVVVPRAPLPLLWVLGNCEDWVGGVQTGQRERHKTLPLTTL